MTSSSITVHGADISQPARAVAHLLAGKGLLSVKPGARGVFGKVPTAPSPPTVSSTTVEMPAVELTTSTSDTYLSKFPAGTFPALEDYRFQVPQPHSATTSPLRITEGPAIMIHLCESLGWGDMLPLPRFISSDNTATLVSRRAATLQWLHWQHSGLRFLTTDVFFHRFAQFLADRVITGSKGKVNSWQDAITGLPGFLAEALRFTHTSSPEEKVKHQALVENRWKDAMLTLQYGGDLARQPFLTGSTPTIADLSCYSEIDQVYYMGCLSQPETTGLGDTLLVQEKDNNKMPGRLQLEVPHDVDQWLTRMRATAGHDDVRTPQCFKIWDRIKKANASKS